VKNFAVVQAGFFFTIQNTWKLPGCRYHTNDGIGDFRIFTVFKESVAPPPHRPLFFCEVTPVSAGNRVFLFAATTA
jgi:hypothetical protein